jgi:hypothetical protein
MPGQARPCHDVFSPTKPRRAKSEFRRTQQGRPKALRAEISPRRAMPCLAKHRFTEHCPALPCLA